MSGNVASIREELGALRQEWNKLDPTIRFLDVSSILLVILFGIVYILVGVLDIVLTVSNAGMMIFPLLIAGYIFVLRSKIADENEENSMALREFMVLVGVTTGLILLSFVYSIFLNAVIS